KAGYRQADTTSIISTIKRQTSGPKPNKSTNARDLLYKLLNQGIAIPIIGKAIIKANRTNRIDSPRNCFISWPLVAPIVLRMPASFARVNDLAVVRFTKFIPAINNRNKAIAEKMYIYRISLPGINSSAKSE